jgi:RNA polymerase sigma factor (sigma-70 family)
MAKDAVDHDQAFLRETLSHSARSAKAVEDLRNRFVPMIVSLARSLSWDGESFEELCQEGNVAFLRALRAFDPNSGARLSTFLYTRIRGQMLHWRRAERARLAPSSPGHVGFVVSLDEPLPQSGDDGDEMPCRGEMIADNRPSAHPFHRVHASLLRDLVGTALTVLPPRQLQALRLRFWNDLSPSQIADRLGVSRPRVTALVKAALSHLREELSSAA